MVYDDDILYFLRKCGDWSCWGEQPWKWTLGGLEVMGGIAIILGGLWTPKETMNSRKIKKVLIYNPPYPKKFHKKVRKKVLYVHPSTVQEFWRNASIIFLFTSHWPRKKGRGGKGRQANFSYFRICWFTWYISIFWVTQWSNLEKVLRKFYIYLKF